MTRALAGVACALAACWSAPPRPAGLPAMPGLAWITERPPYRLARPARRIVVEGGTATVAGNSGWIARIDLATGLTLREHRIGDFNVTDLLRLDDRRWLATGNAHGKAAAAVVDDATFAATPLPLAGGSGETYDSTDAVRMPTGDVAIGGPGLPLALYDPVTWKVRAVVDPELGWSRLRVLGGRLAAARKGVTLAFDLATHKSTKIGSLISDISGELRLERQFVDDKWWIELRDGDKPARRLHDAGDTAMFDPSGTKIYASGNGVVRVYDAASLRELAHYDLGESARHVRASLVLANQRLVIAANAVVRVLDLGTGAITPAGPPPYGEAQQIMVGDDGMVGVIDSSAWKFLDGKLVATAQVADDEDVTSPRGELRRFATVDDADTPAVTLRGFDGAALRRWKFPQPRTVMASWLGPEGTVVVASGDYDGRAHLLRATDNTFDSIVAYNVNAFVDDVDFETGLALLTFRGSVRAVNLDDGTPAAHTQDIPGCPEYGSAVLEHGGGRVLTFEHDELVAWRREVDGPVASLHTPAWINGAAFLPHSRDVLLDYGETLAIWSPDRGELRALAIGASFTDGVSLDGRRLALGLSDGRVALLDLAALRKAMAVVPAPKAKEPASCSGEDPFAVPPESGPSEDSGPDGE